MLVYFTWRKNITIFMDNNFERISHWNLVKLVGIWDLVGGSWQLTIACYLWLEHIQRNFLLPFKTSTLSNMIVSIYWVDKVFAHSSYIEYGLMLQVNICDVWMVGNICRFIDEVCWNLVLCSVDWPLSWSPELQLILK